MLLPQLLESPLFGLTSLDSPQVQELREELRQLQGVGSANGRRSTRKEKRVREIEKELRSASNWDEVPSYLQRTNRLLERVAANLAPAAEDAAIEEIAKRSNPDRRAESA